MHNDAPVLLSPSWSPARQINRVTQRRRLLASKTAVAATLTVVLFSHHTFRETSGLDLAFETTALVLLICAAMGRVWSHAFISGKKNRELQCGGPYSISRNPLYLFSLIGFVGAGLAFESISAAIIFALIFFVTHWPIILKEEGNLTQIFGGKFKAYRLRTSRFLPNFRSYNAPTEVTINARIFGRAVWECSLIIGVFVAANALEWAHLNAKIPVLFHIP